MQSSCIQLLQCCDGCKRIANHLCSPVVADERHAAAAGRGNDYGNFAEQSAPAAAMMPPCIFQLDKIIDIPHLSYFVPSAMALESLHLSLLAVNSLQK